MANPALALPGLALAGGLPSDRISTVIQVPSNEDLDRQIANIEAQLSGLPSSVGGMTSGLLKQTLQMKLARLKTQRLGTTNNGIPPAPDAPAGFANQIATPKVGLDALTIPLPY